MNFVFAGMPFLLTALIAAALSGIVFYHGPGRPVHRALAALLAGSAAYCFGNSLALFSGADIASVRSSPWSMAAHALFPIALLSTVPLALSWPQRRAWTPPLATSLWPYMTVALLLAGMVTLSDVVPETLSRIVSTLVLNNVIDTTATVLAGGAALFLAREARALAASPLRESHVLMALGLGLTYVFTSARDVTFLPRIAVRVNEGTASGWIVAAVLAVALLVGAYAALLWRLPPSRAGRLAKWLILGAGISGVIDSALYYLRSAGLSYAFTFEARVFLYALWFLIPISLLAYVTLRGDIAGLEVKLRWTISKSTIAAAFVAAFFVASEGAQLLFGQGNEWVGLLAAGALVFAIAPLQRVAERLAEKAVPVVEAPRGAAAHPHADAYVLAVRAAMAAGPVSPEVDCHLADLADKLGIRAGEALRLRQAVEQEVVAR